MAELRTRAVVVAVCSLLAASAAQSNPAQPATTNAVAASASAAAGCGTALPVDVVVPAAVSGPAVAVATGNTAAGQFSIQWAMPSGALELRWPPDQRPLYSTHESDAPTAFDQAGESGDGRTLTIGDGANPLMILTLRSGVDALPHRPCDRIQLRRINADGTFETVAFRFGDGGASYDIGPLIANVSDTPGPIASDRSIECGNHPTPSKPITAAASFPTPAEALRAFLESDTGDAVDGPTPPRPFHQFHVISDGTYRFEHFTNWNQHVAITIGPSGAGWVAKTWAMSNC